MKKHTTLVPISAATLSVTLGAHVTAQILKHNWLVFECPARVRLDRPQLLETRHGWRVEGTTDNQERVQFVLSSGPLVQRVASNVAVAQLEGGAILLELEDGFVVDVALEGMK